MINVKLIVLFFSIHNVASSSKYCEICPNHTLCKYNMPGPSSACKDYASTPITKDDVNNIINKINERRNSVALGLAGLPQAANMNKIYWSEELATLAQRWVDQCDASARPDKEDECRDLDGTAVGQAIVSVLGPAPGLQLKNMVDVWFMQTLDYKGSVSYYNQSRDWKTNYFTQLIWGETDRIGCGRARFYVDQKKSIIERLVCNFAPKGNIHGKPVYAVGYPATQCQQHKTPDSRFESLCRSFVEGQIVVTNKPPVGSLLRILNICNKPETDPIRNNLKQVKFDMNETSEQRNQKTRHVLFNNNNGSLKKLSPPPVQGHWNSQPTFSRGQKRQQYQQERGHSRVYHGHANFGPDYRDTTIRNIPTQQSYPISGDYPNNYNYQNLNNEYTTERFGSESSDMRKYNIHNGCTRKIEAGSNCEISHQETTPCTRDHADNQQGNCRYTTPPCQTSTPCNGRPGNACLCNTPSTTCATVPPRCRCDQNCKCFTTGCAHADQGCPLFRRSNNGDNKEETKKPGELHYYDLLPSMVIRSGENVNEQSPLKEASSTSKDDWIEHDDTTNDEMYKRLSPKINKFDHIQVKGIFENKGPNKPEYDYIYDSSYSRERKRRSSADDITFKPFWQMDEFGSGISPLLKSLKYTTLYNKKIKNFRRTNPTIKKSQETETITVKLKDEQSYIKQHQKSVTEKYLSFDELMHLRKFPVTAEAKGDDSIIKPDSGYDHTVNMDGRRADAKKFTTNTPFIRKKHCTRKLTCTWSATTVIGVDGSVIVPVAGGDSGSRTPPGYVEGCTRTSTCTRDFLERNKVTQIVELGGTAEDEDYCQKRALDIRKRDSDEEPEAMSINKQTHTDESAHNTYVTYITEDIYNNYAFSTTTMAPTMPSDSCVCNEESTNTKRSKRKSYDSRTQNYDSLSYGDLYYLVLQKIINWKSYQNSKLDACVCNSAMLMKGTVSFVLFIFLYITLIKSIFI